MPALQINFMVGSSCWLWSAAPSNGWGVNVLDPRTAVGHSLRVFDGLFVQPSAMSVSVVGDEQLWEKCTK